MSSYRMRGIIASVICIAALIYIYIAAVSNSHTKPVYSYETEADNYSSDNETEDDISHVESLPCDSDEDSDNSTEPDSKEITGDTRVYYSPNGKKWHTDINCKYIKNCNTIYELSKDEAEKQGLTPCPICGK